jgi:hypothetical protein
VPEIRIKLPIMLFQSLSDQSGLASFGPSHGSALRCDTHSTVPVRGQRTKPRKAQFKSYSWLIRLSLWPSMYLLMGGFVGPNSDFYEERNSSMQQYINGASHSNTQSLIDRTNYYRHVNRSPISFGPPKKRYTKEEI